MVLWRLVMTETQIIDKVRKLRENELKVLDKIFVLPEGATNEDRAAGYGDYKLSGTGAVIPFDTSLAVARAIVSWGLDLTGYRLVSIPNARTYMFRSASGKKLTFSWDDGDGFSVEKKGTA